MRSEKKYWNDSKTVITIVGAFIRLRLLKICHIEHVNMAMNYFDNNWDIILLHSNIVPTK